MSENDQSIKKDKELNKNKEEINNIELAPDIQEMVAKEVEELTDKALEAINFEGTEDEILVGTPVNDDDYEYRHPSSFDEKNLEEIPVVPPINSMDLLNKSEEISQELLGYEEVKEPMTLNQIELHDKAQVKNPPDAQLTKEETNYCTYISQRERMSETKESLEGTVLDVGASGPSNPGVFTREYAKDHEVTAYDIENIERFEEINPGIPIVKGDAHELPFDNESYDTVNLGNILQYHLDFGKIINEALRCGKKKIIITQCLNKRFEGHLLEFKAKICNNKGIPAFLILEIIKIPEAKKMYDKSSV